jgi:hypothetical protein
VIFNGWPQPEHVLGWRSSIVFQPVLDGSAIGAPWRDHEDQLDGLQVGAGAPSGARTTPTALAGLVVNGVDTGRVPANLRRHMTVVLVRAEDPNTCFYE